MSSISLEAGEQVSKAGAPAYPASKEISESQNYALKQTIWLTLRIISFLAEQTELVLH